MNIYNSGKMGRKKAFLLLTAALALTGCAKREPANNVAAVRTESQVKASNADISKYAGQIQRAVQKEIVDADAWAGRTCYLDINLNPDGTLKSVKTLEGDADFCLVAKSAIEHAKLPTPPSPEVYERVKTATLGFKL